MVEQTEHLPSFEAGKTSETDREHEIDIERLERVLAQFKHVRRGATPKAAAKLSKARRDLLMRSFEAMAREIYQFDALEIKDLSTKSDPRLLVELAQSVLSDTPVDRTERMALKGAERFRALLDKFDGSVSTKWACDFLGSTEAAVRKRVQRKTLLARRMPNGELSFPRFQFNESAGDLVRGLQSFLAHVNSWPVEEIVRFLLVRHNPSVSDENPLAMLKQGRLKQAIALADMHLTQRP